MCRITSESTSPPFGPCESPFTPAPLPRDVFYKFAVKAVDDAGNADPTPATWEFNVETPVTEDQATAEAAAALYFPDFPGSVNMDVPASCGGNPETDCRGGTAEPPADQLQLTSTAARSVVEIVGARRWDVTATLSAVTLQPIHVKISGIDCDVTVNSGPGSYSDWQFSVPLNFVTESASGRKRIVTGDITLNRFEDSDFTISQPPGGSFGCSFVNWGSAYFIDTFKQTIADWMRDNAGNPLCAGWGPPYLGQCPPGPGG